MRKNDLYFDDKKPSRQFIQKREKQKFKKTIQKVQISNLDSFEEEFSTFEKRFHQNRLKSQEHQNDFN